MAKRPTRLAPLTDRTADRRRQQLDDAATDANLTDAPASPFADATTTTTPPPADQPASTAAPTTSIPGEDGITPRAGLSPTGTGGQGGDTDPSDRGDDIAFGVATGAAVPDLQDRLLGGDTDEPDFGAGAPPSGPGNVDQTGAIDPVDDADVASGARGPEDDPFADSQRTLEPAADTTPPEDEPLPLLSLADDVPDLPDDLDD